MSISAAQRRYVRNSVAQLEAMWEQRRRWWFCHFEGDLEGEARAAAKSAKLHAEFVAKTHLPDALVKQWEREWDDWFERQLKRFVGASRAR